MNITGAGNGVVVWQRMPLVFAMMDDVNAAEQPVGTKARLVTGDKVSISVGAAAAGKVVNFRGEDLAAQAPVGQDSAPLFGAPVLQAVPYEQSSEDGMVLDSEGEGEWRPTPRGGASGPWHGGWWLAVYGRNLGKKASDLHDVHPTRLLFVRQRTCAPLVPRKGRDVSN